MAKLERRAVTMPHSIGKLLQAAGMEAQPPEVAMGAMFGAIAHLLAAVHDQWPEAWTTFRAAARGATDDLRVVLASDDPAATIAAIMDKQKRAGRQTIESAQSRDQN